MSACRADQHIIHRLFNCFFVLQLFDGHNGSAAAIYSKENLLSNVLNALPSDLNRDEWVAALPRALVAGFVKTDKDFQERGEENFCYFCLPCCSVISG